MNVPQHDISQIRVALAQIKAQLTELTERVGVQNGRVGKLEGRMDDADERWDGHGHFTHDQQQRLLDNLENMPAMMAAMFTEHQEVILGELKFLRQRQDQILSDVAPWKLREQRLRVTKKVAEWIGADGVRLIEKAGKAAVGISAVYGFVKLLGWA